MKRWYLARMRGERTQQEIAGEAGMSQQYYGMIENGGRGKDMGLEMMERLARALGVDATDMARAEREHCRAGQAGQAPGGGPLSRAGAVRLDLGGQRNATTR